MEIQNGLWRALSWGSFPLSRCGCCCTRLNLSRPVTGTTSHLEFQIFPALPEPVQQWGPQAETPWHGWKFHPAGSESFSVQHHDPPRVSPHDILKFKKPLTVSGSISRFASLPEFVFGVTLSYFDFAFFKMRKKGVQTLGFMHEALALTELLDLTDKAFEERFSMEKRYCDMLLKYIDFGDCLKIYGCGCQGNKSLGSPSNGKNWDYVNSFPFYSKSR